MNTNRQRWVGGGVILLAAVAIWLRDPGWMAAPADTLPLALGIPLTGWLGGPWISGGEPFSNRHRILTALAAVTLTSGWLIGSLTLLAISWTVLAMVWTSATFRPQPRRGRLGWLLLLSFPWLVLEWQSIGWNFRLSSAAVAQHFFNLMAFPVSRDGTHLEVMGLPIEIEAACAGWNLLQLTLLTGVAFGAYEIRSNRRFILLLALLPTIVWTANFIRILILAAIALSFDAHIAGGTVHGLTGIAVLATVLALTKGLCWMLDPPPAATTRSVIAL